MSARLARRATVDAESTALAQANLFTGDLLFVRPSAEDWWEAWRNEWSAWWTGSAFDAVDVVVRDPPNAPPGVYVLQRPACVPFDEWLRARPWHAVVVRRATTKAAPYYGADRVAAALAPSPRGNVAACPRGNVAAWFASTGAASFDLTPRALAEDPFNGLYDPATVLLPAGS